MKLVEAIKRNEEKNRKFTVIEFYEAITRLGFRLSGNSWAQSPANILCTIESFLTSRNKDTWSHYDSHEPTIEFKNKVKEIERNTESLDEDRDRLNELEREIHRLSVLDTISRTPGDVIRTYRGELYASNRGNRV